MNPAFRRAKEKLLLLCFLGFLFFSFVFLAIFCGLRASVGGGKRTNRSKRESTGNQSSDNFFHTISFQMDKKTLKPTWLLRWFQLQTQAIQDWWKEYISRCLYLQSQL